MATNFALNVPKLKGRENYDEWAFAAENFLILEGMLDSITVGKTVAAADDAKAKAKLILTIDPSLYVHIKDATKSIDLWNKLKTMFDDSGFSRRISLLRNLISIRLENSDSMTSYVTQIIETGQRLRGTGFNINDEWIAALMLAGLPERFAPMIMALEHSGATYTTDSIKTKLLDMETESGGAQGGAFASKGWQRGKKIGKNDSISNSNGKTIKCYKCKQTGHFKSQCPNSSFSDNKRKQSNAFSAVFLNGRFSKRDWYIDSGASVHMTANKNWIKNPSYQNHMREIIVANESKVPVLCAGDVQITTIGNECSYDITVRDVLCVPSLTTNLLSVSQLIKNGNKVKFKCDACYIYNQKNELVASANLANGVYKLNMNTYDCFLTSTVASAEVWHRRLGHINAVDMNKMKSGAVEGISYSSNAKISKMTCVVCCEGKQSRLPFTHVGTRSIDVLDVIHGDVCGPMETKSIGGSIYFLLLVDDYSRMAFVYFLKSKNDVFNCFK